MCADAESKPTIGSVVEGRLKLYCFLSMHKSIDDLTTAYTMYVRVHQASYPRCSAYCTIKRDFGSLPNLLSSPHVQRREDERVFPRDDTQSASTTTLGVHVTRRRSVFERRCFGTLLFPVSSGRNCCPSDFAV